MRTAILCLCVLGLTIVVNGQDKSAPLFAVKPSPAAILKARQIEVGVVETSVRREGEPMVMKSRVVAKGDVEIRIGQSLITADEAEIRYGAPGEPDDVELRGNVRLKAHLTVE
jgi:lipopolysaccharide export system protein LptA